MTVREDALDARLTHIERVVIDMQQKFETLETPLWKRVLFRLDGWPGQTDLNAAGRAWRPWHRQVD